ncbi:hypothetical protein [Thermoactinomyces mirandus]|nr:hypothetical protein [Thermoactinomyces mirandus]
MSEKLHHDWFGLPAKIKRQVNKVKAIFLTGDSAAVIPKMA